MTIEKKSKSAAVHVETKRMSGDCCGSKSTCCKTLMPLLAGLILLINLVLLIVFYVQYTHTEAMKVGGMTNYKMVKQIYKTKAFQDGQAQQIKAALEQYQAAAIQQQMPMMQEDTIAPEAE